jgi:ribosomal protein L11 methyltransferase
MKRKEWVLKVEPEKSNEIFELLAIQGLTSFYSESSPSKEEETFHIYTEDDKVVKEIAEKIGTEYELKFSDDEDWISIWRKNLKITRIDDGLYINPDPERLTSPKDGITVKVNLGMAFGTGEHETTKLAAALLKEHLRSDMRVCDVGCGTGILSAIAKKFGASKVMAVDVDENALKQAKETALLNDVDYEVRKSDLLSNVNEKFDLYVANIVFDVLLKLIPQLPKDILFIVSGVDKPRSNDFIETCKEHSFQIIEKRCENEWCAFLMKT